MRKLLLILPVLLLCITASFAQTTNNDAPKLKAAIAEVEGDQVSIQAVLANPVVSISNSRSQVAGFDFAWVVAGTEPLYEGPYTITGNRVNGVALQQLQEDVKKGKVIKMFIDNVRVVGTNGEAKKSKAVMAYKVLP
jgi:hypothetical protein